jgi:hypothetical protein
VENSISCTLRVTAADSERARVTARRQQFFVGRPLELDETSARISALEYALGALAAEVVNGLRIFAARRRLALDAIEALVTGELSQGLAYLEVVGEDGPPMIARARVKVFVASADEAAVRRLWEEVLDRLPLVCTLRRAAAVELELAITP